MNTWVEDLDEKVHNRKQQARKNQHRKGKQMLPNDHYASKGELPDKLKTTEEDTIDFRTAIPALEYKPLSKEDKKILAEKDREAANSLFDKLKTTVGFDEWGREIATLALSNNREFRFHYSPGMYVDRGWMRCEYCDSVGNKTTIFHYSAEEFDLLYTKLSIILNL